MSEIQPATKSPALIAKEERERLFIEKKNKKAEALTKAKLEQKEKWWRDWSHTGRLHSLFQPDLCKSGVHVWRPMIVNGKWDGTAIECVAANCPVKTEMANLSTEDQQSMCTAANIYAKWNSKEQS